MLKEVFVLAVTANLFFIKPTFANTALSSADTKAIISPSNGATNPSSNCTNYSGKELICRKNEVMSECIQGGCQAKTCSDLNRDIPCVKIDPKYCTKGCLCKDGYLRADNGTCVPISGCTFNCTRSNEVFVRCPPICPPQTCESLNQSYSCPAILIPTNTTNCRPACRCKTGYYRNKINECISTDDCLKCTGPNEYFSCGVACDNVCSTLSERNQSKCDIKNIACNKMCYCEEGYARAKNKTCIPINKCTEPQCPVNEKYLQSTSNLCRPQTCSQLGFPLNCTVLTADTNCPEKPGCVCIDGYVRNNKGVCIPQNDCPSCGGDPNAVTGCGVYCNKKCSNIGKEEQLCSDICYKNSCNCKDGYYYDDNTKKCVQPKDCTPTCGLYEIYSDCIQGQCGPITCSQLGKPVACSLIDSNSCIKGCICQNDYVRDNNGTCIPKNNCSTCGGDPNAEPGCSFNCNKQCSSIGVKRICPPIACPANGCACKDGYYYDSNRKKCVLPIDCAQPSTNTSTTPTPTTSVPQGNITTELAAFRKGNLALAGELLYQSVQSNPGVSFVASSLSAMIPFAEISLYAYGLTLEQLLRFLNLNNKDQIRETMPVLLSSFQDQQSVIFDIANKYYANIYYPLTDTFINEAKTIFHSEAENVDFSDQVTAADIINQWVANETNNLIQNLISPDMLSADTRMVLINAMYFLGTWSSQFNPNNTKNKDFYVAPNKTISLPTMYQQGTFNYAEDPTLDAQIIELYYKAGNFSFVIWLPKTIDGLKSMVEKLRDPDTFSNSMNLFTYETVQIDLPKFDITTVINLVDVLEKYNVTEVFNPYTAELKGIVNNNDTIYISNAIQKARIKVDETGIEAVAATAVIGIRATAVAVPRKVYKFEANRSFVFCLFKQKDPLFIGTYTGQ